MHLERSELASSPFSCKHAGGKFPKQGLYAWPCWREVSLWTKFKHLRLFSVFLAAGLCVPFALWPLRSAFLGTELPGLFKKLRRTWFVTFGLQNFHVGGSEQSTTDCVRLAGFWWSFCAIVWPQVLSVGKQVWAAGKGLESWKEDPIVQNGDFGSFWTLAESIVVAFESVVFQD